MESVVDKLPDSSSTDTVQFNEPNSEMSSIQDETHKSNGIVESDNVNTMDSVNIPVLKSDCVGESCTLKDIEATNVASNVDVKAQLPDNSDRSTIEVFVNDGIKPCKDVPGGLEQPVKSVAYDDIQNLNCHLNDVQTEEVVVVECVDSQLGDNVKFETDVVVETNDNDVNEISIHECESDIHESSNNILSEINQSIELNEVLCSSDITQNIENNNCTVRQEVFNKEELLDILEGNDEQSNDFKAMECDNSKILETKMALQQLSRLKKKHLTKDVRKKISVTKKKGVEERKKSSRNKEIKVSNKEKKKKIISKEKMKKETNKEEEKETNKEEENKKETNKEEEKKKETNKEDGKKKEAIKKEEMYKEKNDQKKKETSKEEQKKKETTKEEQRKENNGEKSIVIALVQDWEDDEIVEEESTNENISSTPLEITDQNVVYSTIEEVKRNSVDLSNNNGQTSMNKSGEDNLPQRRLGRVIKKKVIFDPDNPDTFTKRKTQNKNSDQQIDQEQPPLKKGKTDHNSPRAKSKSPISKLQWKKPSSKNIKQNKRLTEVDKLLMDEGAVNMIYQLTPEAPKGKKNMKTKAEFIKKLQSSTPESKEMKFRERKKESSKSEDGEPKKILGGKQRSSLSSSVKSPSAADDFENHSADDSIIYRRHSSSSYSSSCMSPRRLSDVEASNLSINTTQANEGKQQIEGQTVSEINFKTEDSVPTDIINKSDCLTIKRKLNSKLSLALTKRKRDIIKTDKTSLTNELKLESQDEVYSFKLLSLKFDQRVAEICILSTGHKYSEDLLKEISVALSIVDVRGDISVTLLTSESGTLCSDLDLKPLLKNNVEERTKLANEITKTVRSLLWTMEQHSKLLCTGVWGECSGLALALVALSDVAIAAEGASFALTRPAAYVVPLVPGLSSIITSCRRLQQSVVDDLMIFNRQLSSFEALKGGLVTRTLISAGFQGQLKNVVSDIANQSVQSLLLKKKLLNLRKVSEETFLTNLDVERGLIVEFWTSPEGQEMIRGSTQDP